MDSSFSRSACLPECLPSTIVFCGMPTSVEFMISYVLGIGNDAVLMDAGLVREGVRADDGLARRDGHARDVAQQLARAVDLLGVHAGLGVVEVLARVRSAMTISSRLALPARSPMPLTVHSTCVAPARTHVERIGHRHAEVVVAVDGDVDMLDALDVFTQVGDEVSTSPAAWSSRRCRAHSASSRPRRRQWSSNGPEMPSRSGRRPRRKTRCHRNSSWRRRPSRGCGR